MFPSNLVKFATVDSQNSSALIAVVVSSAAELFFFRTNGAEAPTRTPREMTIMVSSQSHGSVALTNIPKVDKKETGANHDQDWIQFISR